jgi:hypothetical protein
METLLGVKHLTRKGDYMFSFDMHDGFYAIGINPTARNYVKRARTIIPTRWAAYGLVLTPLLLLQDATYFR